MPYIVKNTLLHISFSEAFCIVQLNGYSNGYETEKKIYRTDCVTSLHSPIPPLSYSTVTILAARLFLGNCSRLQISPANITGKNLTTTIHNGEKPNGNQSHRIIFFNVNISIVFK